MTSSRLSNSVRSLLIVAILFSASLSARIYPIVDAIPPITLAGQGNSYHIQLKDYFEFQ